MSEGLKGECRACDGTGMVCLSCDEPIDECDCGPDAEPCTCDKCNGSGHEMFESDNAH